MRYFLTHKPDKKIMMVKISILSKRKERKPDDNFIEFSQLIFLQKQKTKDFKFTKEYEIDLEKSILYDPNTMKNRNRQMAFMRRPNITAHVNFRGKVNFIHTKILDKGIKGEKIIKINHKERNI